MIGFHVQRPCPNWLDAVKRLPPGAPVLAVDGVQWLAEAKAANPGVFTVLRHHYDAGQVFPLDWTFDQYKDAARRFFATFIDGTFRQYAQHVNAIKEFNEYWANSQTSEEVRARVWWARAAAQVWDEYRDDPDYRHIRLVLGSAAIGNDMPVELASIAWTYDCLISYHAYVYWPKANPPEWEWPTLSGRWDLMDMEYTAAGYDIDWIFTECGPFESAVTGWRSSEVCGGSVDCYLASIRYFIDHVATTPAFKQGRVIGGVLFTTYPNGDWPGYNTQQPEMNTIADMVREYAPSVPPAPPEEPPMEPVPYIVVVNLLPQDASFDEKIIALDAAHEKRETILQSADDAARLVAPGRVGSKVIVWDAERWQPGDIGEWLQERGVKIVEFARFETEWPD